LLTSSNLASFFFSELFVRTAIVARPRNSAAQHHFELSSFSLATKTLVPTNRCKRKTFVMIALLLYQQRFVSLTGDSRSALWGRVQCGSRLPVWFCQADVVLWIDASHHL